MTNLSDHTLLVIKMEYFFLHNFMGYFLLWEIFRMSRVFTTTMLIVDQSLPNIHAAIKSDNIHLLQDVSLA